MKKRWTERVQKGQKLLQLRQRDSLCNESMSLFEDRGLRRHVIISRVIIASILAFSVLNVASIGRADTTARDADALAKATYLYIATVRKDGNQSKAAPVWFIVSSNQVLIDTNSDTWKAKRVRRGSPFIVWIGTRTGPAFIGKAEIVQDTAVQDMMLKEIPKKYFLARIGLVGPSRAKFDSGKAVTIRITPESDLPDGFQSQPGAPAPKLKHE